VKNLIEIHDFNFTYPQAPKKALTDLTIQLPEGSFTVLFGKSGSGKTTLLRQLKPSLAPHGHKTGEILVEDRPLATLDLRTQTTAIGYVLQNPDNQIVTDKVWHELAFGLESLGLDQATIRLRVAEMASYFGIQHWFKKEVTELSGGQKQLLNLASIMTLHPKLLILDEPTSQLDPIAASDFLETIAKINREIGTTILMTEHRLQNVLPMADQVLMMADGQIVASGSPQSVGQQLAKQQDDLFIAMPAPMQIAASQQANTQPLTVREGRQWLETLQLVEKTKAPEQLIDKSHQPMIRASNVFFRYDKDGPDVVADLALSVEKGELFSLMGGNGTGKSTLLSLLSRIQRPYRGKIELAGKRLEKYSDQQLYRQFLGVLPQNPQSLFTKKTVRADLYEVIDGPREKKSAAYPLQMDKAQAVAGIVELTHLEELLNRHPYDLSGGEQQRVALAKIMLLRPQLLLLDEPTKGLDDFFKQEFGEILQTLKNQGVTIVMVSHDVEFVAEYADKVGLFFDGQIATVKYAKDFFAGNNFYTTAANRMSRAYFPDAVTVKDVIACLNAQKNS
jgi:energy-coupling factor transport system ATP-binding protein